MLRSLLWNIVKRPSLWTCLIALVAYRNSKGLHGKWVYDDAGSVAKNVVVNGQVPWKDAFTRDFWGTPMNEPQSHKSFRPITTLSFKLNWMLADYLETNETDEHTYYFHVVNVILHGISTLLVTEVAAFVFDDVQVLGGTSEGDVLAQFLTGAIFALHPVHAESVSNITSRGEMLMSIFFLLAFLSYACHIPDNNAPRSGILYRLRYTLCIYVIPWVCMGLSLFSKEQGATALCTIVAYDFLKNHNCVQDFLYKLLKRDWPTLCFLGRTTVLAIQTLILVGFRHWLNGETSPDFIYDQNPAGFSEDRFTRVFSVSWVYCLYILDALYPVYLSPDWSGRSIILIDDISDPRALLVIFLWIFAFSCVQSLFQGLPPHATRLEQEVRRVLLMAFFAFLFLPFLLSSNLLVVVGLMKADRVIYLPLFGFCIMEALLFKTVCCSYKEVTSSDIAADSKAKTSVKTNNESGQKDGTSKSENDNETNKCENNNTNSAEEKKNDDGKEDNNKEWEEIKDDNGGNNNGTDDKKAKPETTSTAMKEDSVTKKKPPPLPKLKVNVFGHLLVLIQLGLFACKQHERNIAWSSPELLWVKAYNVNPRSHHTMYNCGYELSLRQRFEEAEAVMRPIGNARVDGPSNTFVYAMVLYNLGRCDEANDYIDIAMDVLEEQREEGGVRHQASALDRTKSNLLVARGYCAMDDFKEQGMILQEAVRTDPRNTYAVQQFQAYLKKMEQIREMKEKYGMQLDF